MRLVSTLLAALPLAVAVPVIEERQTNLRPRYIVVFKPEAPASIFETVFDALPSLVPDYIYNIGSFKGFAAPLTEALLTTVTSLSSVSQPSVFTLHDHAFRYWTFHEYLLPPRSPTSSPTQPSTPPP